MTMLCKKLLSAVLALMVIFSLAPVALAEETLLQVTLTGIYPSADGTEKSVPVSAAFDVYQAEVYVGRLEVTPEGDNTIALPGEGSVRIAPVAGTYPAELLLNAYGYAVSIAAGRLNIAPLVVYADVEAPAVIPEVTEVPTPVPTAAPTATLAPTEAPTATPAPTEAPTATPEPTEVPTATPVTGGIVLTLEGDEATVSCTLEDSAGTIVAKGTLQIDGHVFVGDLRQGEYVITLHLPENVAVTAVNGNEIIQRGDVQWRVPVEATKTSQYMIEVTNTGSAVIPFKNIDSAEVTLRHAAETIERKVTKSGRFSIKGLLPGSYLAEVRLPAGTYLCDENYSKLTEQEDGTVIIEMPFALPKGGTAELPRITRKTVGTVSGMVYDMKGAALSGVQVEIVGENGEVAATAETDKQGAWKIAELSHGTYTVRYQSGKRAIPASAFTLVDGSETAELRTSEAKSAKISVRAFVDANNNGTSGKGEGFVKNVEVSLITEDGAVSAAGKTGKDGYVTLTAPEGKYFLQATAPADYGFGKQGSDKKYTHSIMDETGARTQRSALLTLSPSQSLEVGVGLQEMAVVTGTVWQDVNADGLWQKDEPGIPGVRITLTGTRNGDVHDVTTDANGWYEFRQVRSGNYRLNCYVPDEYVFTVKAKGELAEISRMTTEKDRIGEDSFSLERGETHEDHNIGLMKGLIIEGVCFLDANNNGVYDEGDEPLPGVQMHLARQSNNVLLQTVVSGEDGRYSFVGQRGSTFTVRATLPKGCAFAVLGEGEEGNRFAPNGNKAERKISDITIDNGGHAVISVGAVKFGSISGRVYFDNNFSASWENGEKAGAEYLVTLCDAQGEKIITTKADKNGNYTFANLNPGQYLLRIKPAAGYAFTALGAGNVMQTLPDGSGLSRVLTVGMGENVTGAGAGMIVPAVVSGVFFADDNDNGLLDSGEMGLKGSVVRLMNEQGEVFSKTIDASGEYSFNAVLPGKYYVQYELPANAVFTKQVSGGSAISGDLVGVSDYFSVESGTAWQAPLCGGVLLSDISGAVFADSNGNALMDEAEDLLAGMEIVLTPSRSDLETISINVGSDGAFAMTGLRPDQYTLTVTCPEGYVLSRLSEVDLPVQHGLHTQQVQLNLKMGTQWHDQYLGCVLPASWTGEVYLDENYDGLRGADEAPATGETIVLIDADTGEVVSSVQTDAQGVFVIEGIAPGEYELTYPLDEGNLLPKEGDTDFTANGNVLTNGRVRVYENERKSGTVLAVVRTTEISGRVWLEEYDGVTPIRGAKLHLLDAQGNAIAEYATGDDGKYAFKGLMPGDYAVDVTIPSGYVLVESSDPHLAEAGLVSFVEEALGLFGKSPVITLKMAGHRLDMDAGVVLPGRLGDKVWLDLNGNGLQDGAEGGLPGVTIELMRGEKVVASTVSDQYGYYVFEGLYPTEYTLRATWPGEVMPTIRRTDVHQINSVLLENGLSVPVEVESNKANYAADLGFVLLEEGKYPAGYGEGEKQVWRKKK